MKRALVFLMCLSALHLTAQTRRPITFDDLIGFGRVTDPRISPDGKTVAFVVTYHDKVKNKTNSNIYLVPAAGGDVRQLTSSPGANHSPRWMPDGKSIAFLSTRSGNSEIWTISTEGGEAKRISSVSTGCDGLMISPDGKYFAFNSEVFPDLPDDASNKERNEQLDQKPSKARLFDRLPIRIWTSWKEGKRSHVFVMPAAGGTAKDMTPGDYDSPPIDLNGNVDYGFSPDGNELAFTRNTDSAVVLGTNNDIFTVPLAGGQAKRITTSRGNDNQPVYSPDGKYLSYRKMARPGFEADRQQLILVERASGNEINLTANLDLSIDEVVWSPDCKTIYFNADEQGSHVIYSLSLEQKTVKKLYGTGYNRDLALTPDGNTLVFIHDVLNKPAEVYRMDVDGSNVQPLTGINDAKCAELDMPPGELFFFKGAGGTKVNGWLQKPPAFDLKKKYPVVYLLSGGPQGQWGDQFHYRWNSQMFAARGYVVLMVNRRGSTGMGQKFTDEISKDWGGKAYEDLKLGLDYAIKTWSFIDGKRAAAAGASYGGYMINWMAGHTNRFRCLVSHSGLMNLTADYGSTEELWFPEWEFGGTPYDKPALYEKWNPYKFVKNFKTPTLVVHGQLDYRVDVSEGFQMFTALQRQGVKSKFLYFPDEGHWVAKPANAEVWYRTVLDWIDENTK